MKKIEPMYLCAVISLGIAYVALKANSDEWQKRMNVFSDQQAKILYLEERLARTSLVLSNVVQERNELSRQMTCESEIITGKHFSWDPVLSMWREMPVKAAPPVLHNGEDIMINEPYRRHPNMFQYQIRDRIRGNGIIAPPDPTIKPEP